jgi:phage terminase large subunit
MLCLRPSRENVVFGNFNVKFHVRLLDYDPNLPLYRAIDFGYVNPFVCLFIQVDEFGIVRVVDEYVARIRTVSSNAQKVIERTPVEEDRVSTTYCDPSGASRNDIDGSSAVKELRNAGIRVKYRKSSIHEGIELIRRHLRSGEGLSRLIVSNNCPRLIEAMECYHYPDQPGELPVKDGVYDHPVDALRYFFVNYFRKGKSGSRPY